MLALALMFMREHAEKRVRDRHTVSEKLPINFQLLVKRKDPANLVALSIFLIGPVATFFFRP